MLKEFRKNKYSVRFTNAFWLIRKVSGWTSIECADRTGTTRQSIGNIERHKNNLSLILYNALRYAFLNEMRRYPEETLMLKIVLDVLVDNPEKYPIHIKASILKYANIFSPSMRTVGRQASIDGWKDALKKISNIDILQISDDINIKCWIENNKNKE